MNHESGGVCYFYVQGELCMVDASDSCFVSAFDWIPGTRGLERVGDRKLLHRLLMGVDEKTKFVLHRNKDLNDNRRNNLRAVTASEFNKGRSKPRLFNKDGSVRGVRLRTVTHRYGGKRKSYTFEAAIASVYEKGKSKAKWFPTLKHGKEGALKLAIQARIKYLIENHGNMGDGGEWNLWESENLREAFYQGIGTTKGSPSQ